MNAPSSLDFSLYKIALSALPALHPLQLSAATLDSVVTAIIDLLMEQEIAAGLLVKMPTSVSEASSPTNSWLTQIQNYQNNGNPLGIYVFQSGKPETTDTNLELVSDQSSTPDPVSRHPETHVFRASSYRDPNRLETHPSDTITSSLETIYLSVPVEATLARESFLLVFSEQFCLTLVAHQPRSIRFPESPPKGTKSSETPNKSARTTSIPHERQPFFLSVCSAHPQTLKNVLEGLEQGVSELSSLAPTLKSWLNLTIATSEPTAIPINIVEQLWLKQISQQEQVWHALSNARASAADATSLLLQNEELLEAMQLKDEFLSNVGQELRTPLTNMKTALTLLNSPNLKPAQRERYMQVLHTECDRQTSLINGLLEMVRLDHVVDQRAMQPLLLIDIVPGVVSTYQPLANEKGVMLAYTIPDHLPPVACLRPWLKQIVINLLNNGIKYTPKGGQVWVKAKQQGDYVQIEFRDTGIGIPTHELHKIFERFYRVRQTTEDDPGGAGLGLTMVQQLLLRCGGSITVKSQVREGSVFLVLLPVYQDN
jgi:two-component system phosphate regulon sensor histidine kinase PhoR